MSNNSMTPRLRRFTSLALTLTSLLLAITGIILYVMPHGRIAYWNDFRIWGLGKDPWTSLHLILALLFIILATTHAVLNIKPLVRYLKSKVALLAVAVGTVLLFVVTAVVDAPPSSWLMSGSECAKTGWDEPSPPMPHFEMQSLKAVAGYHGEDVEDLIDKLAKGGVDDARPEETIGEVAERTGKTPATLYEMMGGSPDSKPFTDSFRKRDGRGQGFGKGDGRGRGGGRGRRGGGRRR